jgi:hypothetical protein
MCTENRLQENLQSAAGKRPESAARPLGEISSNIIQSSKRLLSAREQQYSRIAAYDPRSIDDLATQFSQTRIGTRRSTKSHAYPSTKVSNQAEAIRHVIQEVLAQDLKAARGEKLQPNHPCFQFASQYAKKWAISDEAVQNHIKLACGYLNFPVILLLNPAPTHEKLPFDQMVKNCKTLKWIEDVLREIGLELDDVIILDACTLLGSNPIDELARVGRKEEAISEAYDVTQKMLQMLKPNIILSCQCSTSFSKWGSGAHFIARELCSSIQRAKNKEVRRVATSGHIINVIQAYHPSGFLRLDRGRNRKSHHDPTGEFLKGLFEKVYLPCVAWKNQHIMASKSLTSISTDASVKDENMKENIRR